MAFLSPVVENFLSTQIPPEVWHYTTVAGLEGILSTDSVWATEAHFTTDKSEFIHAREVAINYLASVTPIDAYAAQAIDAASGVVKFDYDEGPLSKKLTEVFVVSFSAASDLKSQWTEYADGGRGVSLAFDLSGIRPPLNLEMGITLAPCVYEDKEKEKLLEAALSHFVETAAGLHREVQDKYWIEQKMRDWAMIQSVHGLNLDKDAFKTQMEDNLRVQLYEAKTRSSFDLLRIASHCKDMAFEQEKEWRLALPRLTSKPLVHGTIQYRGPNHNIPYIASNLFRNGKHLPITRVMVGPLCEDQERIEKIIRNCGYQLDISRSAVPLRDPAKIR